MINRIISALPEGRTLEEDVWKKRHLLVVSLLIIHAVGLFIFALVRGYDITHSLLEAAIPAAAALGAFQQKLSRKVRSVMATLGLLTCSALLVHFSGGVIEAHFHFFVMVVVVSLYQDWTPFLLAIAYVVLQHGTIGIIDPIAVYNHPAAVANPWKWAGIHGLFIAAESAACLVYWRLSEDAWKGRARAEQRLVESEARFRSAFRNSAAGMMLVTADGTITEVNNSMCRILGYEETELNGMTWQAITHPEDLESNQEARDRVHGGEEESGHLTKRYIRKDGETVWAEISFTPVRDETGEPQYYVTQVQDVTERRKAEEVNALLEGQLRQSQKMDAVGRLAGGIAHDFNNLLAVILNFASFLKDDLPANDPRVEDIEEIRKAGHRGARLIRQLLAFSRRDVVQPQVVDLNDVVAEMRKLFGRTLGEDIELEVRAEQDLSPVFVDGGHIEQVLLNLAVNARDAMPNGGSLVIETTNMSTDEDFLHRHPGMASGSYVCLSVSDTGTGISEEVQAHIFEPFFTTKSLGEGTGLGLSTVYGIVKQSGGYVTVYSEPDHGSTFRIYLPSAAKQVVQEVQTITHNGSTAGGGKTILLVEDEDSVRRLATRILTESGYKVLSASCGEEALKVLDLHSGHVDLVLTDVIMPKMSGRELVDRIAMIDPGVKAIFMSGYTDEIIAQQGLLGEGVAFIQKPFERDDLLRKVYEVVNPGPISVAESRDPKVLIVDDEEPMRDVLRTMLSARFKVIGDAHSGEAALEFARKEMPDIVVLDYRMSGMAGDEIAPLLRDIAPDVKIVAFSAVLDERPVWADDYLGKNRIIELTPLITRVMDQTSS